MSMKIGLRLCLSKINQLMIRTNDEG